MPSLNSGWNSYCGITITMISTKAINGGWKTYPYKFQFISKHKKSKTVRIRYWNGNNQGKGREVTREEAIQIYKRLIEEGYLISN
jgi:hypothetical protein